MNVMESSSVRQQACRTIRLAIGLQMRIYIDEAGAFVPPNPPRSLFSIVLALIIPSAPATTVQAAPAAASPPVGKVGIAT
jgi:hypothetical protein